MKRKSKGQKRRATRFNYPEEKEGKRMIITSLDISFFYTYEILLSIKNPQEKIDETHSLQILPHNNKTKHL